MSFANATVAALLRSPFHRALSGSTDLIRYVGRRSGCSIATPTQYATLGDDLVIFVAQPESKTWWRNFLAPRDLDVLIAGEWRAMTGHAVLGTDDPDQAQRLLDVYLARFPRAATALGPGGENDVRRAVLVHCQPRAVPT